jgi:L-lysine exporter family protein LysE/ArgO
VGAIIAGLLTGLSLIVAIGAQNAYVLRMGLTRHHISLIVAICVVADIALIVVGIAGIGGVIRSAPAALQVLRWVGVVYLCLFALQSFGRAFHPGVLLPSEATKPTRSAVVSTTLALTFHNPHVYLDTVLLLGSIGNQYGHERWFFALGASMSSLVWFAGLGYGARFASRLMSRPVTWRALDCAIGVVMLLIALKLTLTPLPS